MMKKAFITGIAGQDGSYLAELLLKKGYEVHGLIRKGVLKDPEDRSRRTKHIDNKIILHSGTIENYPRILEIFEKVQPDECYHLAAQSFVYEPFDDCFSTFNTNIYGTLNVLSAMNKKTPNCRLFFAGTSEMFGKVKESPQTENTRFNPHSPYGITKVNGFQVVKNFREAYNLFACTGILFNHESPRRGHKFVTRKITKTISKIKAKKENILILGNLDAKRDWGFAGDYVEAMWLMLQQDNPEDFVIATGEVHTIREFLDEAFQFADLEYEIVDLHNYSIKDADQKIEELRKLNKIFIIQHPLFYRPTEVSLLVGNSRKARRLLGWTPKITFKELIKMMVEADKYKENYTKSSIK